jgi:large subunit ribosomal protein L21
MAMYAVIRTGGKQHRVSQGEKLKIEKIDGDVGAKVTLDDVLLIGGEGDPKIGKPRVAGASVAATIVAQAKHPKVIAFKRRRRKGFHKAIGHRQTYTEIEITGIKG